MEVDAESEGSLSALAPIVPSLVALSLAAAALRLGFLEMASFTSLVIVEELNSESQPVEMRPFCPFAAALHELGALFGAEEVLAVFTCLAHPDRMRMQRVEMPRMERSAMVAILAICG